MVHVCVHGCSMDVLVTVPSTDTRTWGMVNVCVHGCSTNVLVTVPSTDARTWGMVHVCVCPQMFHGRPSYCAIHRY